MKYILLKSILINNDIVGVVQSPERNCKNIINKEIFHTKSELKLNRRLWQFRRKTLGKLIQEILVIWFWQGNDRRCESPRAKSFHCEPILKTFSPFYWDFLNWLIIYQALVCNCAKGGYWGFSKGWKIWKKTSVHSAAHILTSCQHTEHDALGSSPCMTGSSELPLFPSLKSYQHNKHNKTKVKIKTFWNSKAEMKKMTFRYRTSVASEGW